MTPCAVKPLFIWQDLEPEALQSRLKLPASATRKIDTIERKTRGIDANGEGIVAEGVQRQMVEEPSLSRFGTLEKPRVSLECEDVVDPFRMPRGITSNKTKAKRLVSVDNGRRAEKKKVAHDLVNFLDGQGMID